MAVSSNYLFSIAASRLIFSDFGAGLSNNVRGPVMILCLNLVASVSLCGQRSGNAAYTSSEGNVLGDLTACSFIAHAFSDVLGHSTVVIVPVPFIRQPMWGYNLQCAASITSIQSCVT